jgi:hypothetical protein
MPSPARSTPTLPVKIEGLPLFASNVMGNDDSAREAAAQKNANSGCEGLRTRDGICEIFVSLCPLWISNAATCHRPLGKWISNAATCHRPLETFADFERRDATNRSTRLQGGDGSPTATRTSAVVE